MVNEIREHSIIRRNSDTRFDGPSLNISGYIRKLSLFPETFLGDVFWAPSNNCSLLAKNPLSATMLQHSPNHHLISSGVLPVALRLHRTDAHIDQMLV